MGVSDTVCNHVSQRMISLLKIGVNKNPYGFSF